MYYKLIAIGIISVISRIRIIKYTTYNTYITYNSYPNTKKASHIQKKCPLHPEE